jgi:hypothetical protein
MHKKKHHAEHPEIRDSQRFKFPVKEFREMKAHDQQYGERPKQIKIARVGRHFCHGRLTSDTLSGPSGGMHAGTCEGIR